jgi:uncharacterized protein
MIYLDTSVLISALTKEARTAAMQVWLLRQGVGQLTISEWVVTEFSSALAIKQRSAQIDPIMRQAALQEFARLRQDTFRVVPILASSYRLATSYCDQVDLSIRASDALHLAICKENGGSLGTLDRRFAEAALAIGVAVVQLYAVCGLTGVAPPLTVPSAPVPWIAAPQVPPATAREYFRAVRPLAAV